MRKTYNHHALLLSMVNSILSNKINILLKSRVKGQDLFKHYRNMLSIMLSIDEPSIYRVALLLEKYIRSIESVREYYDLEEAEYIQIHHVLKKSLTDEIGLLKIQGASSILSRLLFLAASVNPLIAGKPELAKYVLQLANILSMPVPPQADEAKVVDLLKPSEELWVFAGSLYSLWVLDLFLRELVDRGYHVSLYICSEAYELNLSGLNASRHLKNMPSQLRIEEVDCGKIIVREDSGVFKLVLNNLAIYRVLDTMYRHREVGNTVLVFNPIGSPLQEILGLTPIVISIESLKNILFKRTIDQ